MAKSNFAHAVDQIQGVLRPVLKDRGFSVRGRTFNCVTDDGLTQVVSIQMGASDPPGTTYIPGLRENLHGLFTVNLGVYVPEVARYHGGGEARSWVQEYHCCVRARLGDASGEKQDIWWHARTDGAVVDDVRRLLELGGLPFLDRFSSRDRILAEWTDRSENMGPAARHGLSWPSSWLSAAKRTARVRYSRSRYSRLGTLDIRPMCESWRANSRWEAWTANNRLQRTVRCAARRRTGALDAGAEHVADHENQKPVAWIMPPTTWREVIHRLLRRYIPRPVFALGEQDLYVVIVHGSGFSLPTAGGEPVDGFYTTRVVAARDVREAKQRALSAVETDWKRQGRGAVALDVEEVRVLEERFRARSGSGDAFYRSSDEDGV